MRRRAGPPQENGAEPRGESIEAATRPNGLQNRMSECPLQLVQPVEMGFEEAAREALVDAQDTLPVRELALARHGGVQALLDGEVTLWAGDEQVVLGPGGFFNAPRGVPHTYRVTSDEPATVLVASAPGGFAAFVRAYGVPAERPGLPVLDGPPDVERLACLAAEHGITLLGPPGMLPTQRSSGRSVSSRASGSPTTLR